MRFQHLGFSPLVDMGIGPRRSTFSQQPEILFFTFPFAENDTRRQRKRPLNHDEKKKKENSEVELQCTPPKTKRPSQELGCVCSKRTQLVEKPWKQELNFRGFHPNDIEIERKGNGYTIEAKREVRGPSGFSCTGMSRYMRAPLNVNLDAINIWMDTTTGILHVEAPRKQPRDETAPALKMITHKSDDSDARKVNSEPQEEIMESMDTDETSLPDRALHEEEPVEKSVDVEESTEVNNTDRPAAHQSEPVPVDRSEPGPVDRSLSGSVDRSLSGSVDRSLPGPVDRSLSGPVDRSLPGPVDRSLSGPVDRSLSGPVDRSLSGSVDRSQSGPVDRSQSGPVDSSLSGPVDRSLSGPVDRSLPGPVDRSLPGSVDRSLSEANRKPALEVSAGHQDNTTPAIIQAHKQLESPEVFKIELMLPSYNLDNINVKVVGHVVHVQAEQAQEDEAGMYWRNSMVRRFPLPDDVDRESLTCTISDEGRLSVCGSRVKLPRQQRESTIVIKRAL